MTELSKTMKEFLGWKEAQNERVDHLVAERRSAFAARFLAPKTR